MRVYKENNASIIDFLKGENL